MLNQTSAMAALLLALAGLASAAQAETLTGRVDKVDVAAGEIHIDGVRYTLTRNAREPGGGKPMLSRLQAGDGVLYTPGPGKTLLRIEKPTGGVDLPMSRFGGS